MSLSPEILAELRARHLAFLEARLVGAEAEAEWRTNVAAIWADLLAARVRDLADAPALAAALDTVLTPDLVEKAARPLAQRILPLVLRELRAEPGKLADHVPAPTRAKIEALLSRPSLTPDRILRELAEQEAIQEVLRDVLFDGLKEFSEKVNPFIAEWGIPSLLKRMSLFGGAMTKGLESVRAELDRRSEPEIQRFLAGFTKKGLRKMVEASVSRPAADPKSVALRRHMLTWLLDQELSLLVREADAEGIALGQEVVVDLVAADFARAARAAQRRRIGDELLAAAGDLTVAEALAALGVTLAPDLGALAAATWPLVKTLVEGPAVRGWMHKLVGEFYDAEAKR
jgi:hypothetical protein